MRYLVTLWRCRSHKAQTGRIRNGIQMLGPDDGKYQKDFLQPLRYILAFYYLMFGCISGLINTKWSFLKAGRTHPEQAKYLGDQTEHAEDLGTFKKMHQQIPSLMPPHRLLLRMSLLVYSSNQHFCTTSIIMCLFSPIFMPTFLQNHSLQNTKVLPFSKSRYHHFASFKENQQKYILLAV